jgi:hypothetical protein
MTEPRQKSIGITPQEKATLDTAKRLYEKKTGDQGDWGKFLGAASILALAALGIYKLTKSNRSKPVVECPVCMRTFAVACSGNLPSVVHIQCPECNEEIVVHITD